MELRITNETDETITVKPGETVQVRGREEQYRVLASRKSKLIVTGHGERQ